MELRLSIDYIYSRTNSLNYWWRKTTVIESIIDVVLSSEIIQINHFQIGETFFPIKQIQNNYIFINEIKKHANGVFFLCQEENTNSNYVQVWLNEDCIGIDLYININIEVDQLELLKKIVLNIYNEHSADIILGPAINIFIPSIEYPQIRPPKITKA